MPASNSHLQLDSYFLSELSYGLKDSLEARPQNAGGASTVAVEIADKTTTLNHSSHEWRCELIIQSKPENHTYDFRIVMVGFFRVDSKLDEANAKLLAEANCPAVLYSTSREIIATVTRRSPYPATLLPLVTFVQLPPKKPEQAAAKKPIARKLKKA